MSDSLPKGWTSEPLRNVAQVVSGGTPSRYVPEFWENGEIPWVTPTDITGSCGRFLFEAREHISERGLKSCSTKLLPTGTLLMTSRATLGEVRIAACEVCTNQGFKSLIPFRGVDNGFLFYQIAQNKERYKGLGIGSTFLEVNKRDTERFEVLIAPEPQQRRIAEIISTLDEAIEQTEELIEKMQQVKAGLMHDLFTRGVTPDGHLRPNREQAPSLYKESPLGWIPKEWEVKPCFEICTAVIDCKNRTPPITTDGHPVIRTPNVRNGEFVWSDLNYTDADSFDIWTARGKPQAGDIVITREAPVGEVCMIPENLQDPCLGQRMMLYRPDPEQVHAAFMLQALQSPRLQKHLDVISGGSTVGHVKVGEIRTLRLPCPQLEEQQAIANALDSVRLQMNSINDSCTKLRQQKHGLMQDLLTGRVLVPVVK